MAVENIAVTNFRRYLRIDTMHPTPDYTEAVQFLREMAAELACGVTVVEPVPANPFVILTRVGRDPHLPSVCFYSHVDVVPVFPEHWTHAPFSAHKDADGNIYARGAQDMKCVGIQSVTAW